MNAITVEIIEPSPALAIGLKTLIETSDCNYFVAGVFQDFLSFQIGRKTNSNVILINPLLVDFHTNIRHKVTFCDTNAILVAIPYGYINHKALEGYDGELNLFDDGPELCRVLTEIVEKHRHDAAANGSSLSNRGKEILVDVAHGMTNKEIAAKLKVSIHTVISHRRKIASQTGLKGAAAFAHYAASNGLL